MLRRLTYLENRKTLADSGTLQTDINVRDPITALWVQFRGTNGGTDNKANLMAQCVSKIEVIDGGEILYSLSGEQSYALACYRLGYMPYQQVTEVPGNTQTLDVPLMFGRWFGDPQFALDPTKFVNPQVRVTWDLAAVRAVGATGYLTATGELTVVADIMEGGPSPVGVLKAAEQYSFTAAASGVEYVDLPRDYPYRRIMIRAAEAGSYVPAILTNAKLNVDQGRYVPFDFNVEDYFTYLTRINPAFVYKHEFHAKDGDTIYMIPKYDEGVALLCSTGNYVVGYGNAAYGQGTCRLYVGGVASGAERNLHGVISGWMPFYCFPIDFGDPSNPEDFFPAPSFRSVRLELTQGNAGGAVSVVVEQAKPY